jgi:adenylate cyclase
VRVLTARRLRLVAPAATDHRQDDTYALTESGEVPTLPPSTGLFGSEVDDGLEWLQEGAQGESPEQMLARVALGLRRARVPVERLALVVLMLHPSTAGRGFIWTNGGNVEVKEVSLADLRSGPFAQSPIMKVVQTRTAIRRRICDPGVARDYPILADMASEGVTDYVVLPVVFTTGECHAVSLTTTARDGFTPSQIETMRQLLGPAARMMEILVLRRLASTLLNTYVGHDSGERILGGRIRRGDVEMIRSVVWFSDLRGFTKLSASLPARETIGVLNDVFDCQVPAIERHGGEVLKFIGDGLLASFSIDDEADSTRVVELAIDAAKEAQAALDQLNTARGTTFRIGVALNLGDVAYGNIGSANRLDFTAIGAAVNLTARLEGLTGQLGEPLILSEEIVRRTKRRTRTLGSFILKGVPDTVEAFGLADEV